MDLAERPAGRPPLDPAVANELNLEPWWQSGVVWGGSGGIFASLAALFHQASLWGTTGFSFDASVGAGVTLATSGFTIYRRLAPGLKPMFHGWRRVL